MERLQNVIIPFLLPTLYLPIFAEAANTPKWVLLSALLPVFILCTERKWLRVHTYGAIFLIFSVATSFWAISYLDALNTSWKFLLIGLAFYAATENINTFIKWFCIGVIVSGFVGIAQIFGFDWIQQTTWNTLKNPAGLLVNKNYLAEVGLFGVIGALVIRQPILAVLCLPAFILPMSRGAFVAFACVVGVIIFKKNKIIGTGYFAMGVAGLIAILTFYGNASWDSRLALWLNGLSAFKFFGWGAGNFWNMYPPFHDAVRETGQAAYNFSIQPKTAHNDYITLLVETGVPGLLLYLLILKNCLWSRYGYVVWAFVFVSLFSFPLYLPHTSIFAAVVAGWIVRNRNRDRVLHGIW